jgi:putative tricarboxylic transport membrane protein
MLLDFGQALGQVVTPTMLLLCLVGVVGGMAVGATPGLSATVGLALLLPITFTMEPISGLVLMGAFYMGAIYGGSFTAILVNAPGTPSSIATTFDGYPMTQQGHSERAVVASTMGSVVGGVVGILGLLLLAPPLAQVVLAFGPQEYFWMGIFGLTMIASIAPSLVKGFAACALGLLIATIGISPVGGEVRFTFGLTEMQGGVPLIVALIGLFTIPTILDMLVAPEARNASMAREAVTRNRSEVWTTIRDILSRPVNLIRSSVIGAVVGILPGAGGSIANLIAYNEAKRTSKNRKNFGKGEIDGVVAPEAANNGVVGGSMIPLLTLGIPGAPPDAVIYGVLLLHGLRPGPDLFAEQGVLTFTFILAVGVSALLMGPVGLFAGRNLQKAVVRTPTRYLAPAIALLTIVGAYAVRNSTFDVVMMVLLGLAAYGLRRLGLPPAAVVLGVVLGPIIETGLAQGLLTATAMDHPWMSFFTRPLSLGLIALSVIGMAWPLYTGRKERKRELAENSDNEEAVSCAD